MCLCVCIGNKECVYIDHVCVLMAMVLNSGIGIHKGNGIGATYRTRVTPLIGLYTDT